MTPLDGRPVVVVPCYNEERRILPGEFLALARRVHLLFVDDGSTDGTGAILSSLAGQSPQVEVLRLESNVGKAEAVRRGLVRALGMGAALVGYYDADMATPGTELLRLVETAERRPELTGVLGCRVARLGSSIDRRAVRHYLGRVYATMASAVLGLAVYDTQCGAKVFRAGDALCAALARPFRSRWSFDVELLHRLLHGDGTSAPVAPAALCEVPLESWRDVGGSKLSLAAAAGAFADLALLAARGSARSRVGRRRRLPTAPVARLPSANTN